MLADRTVVLVTHDVLDALLLADRVVVLEAGRVVEEGPASEVLSRPRSAFAARLAGLNLVAGTWAGDAVRSDEGVTGARAGVRPGPGGGRPRRARRSGRTRWRSTASASRAARATASPSRSPGSSRSATWCGSARPRDGQSLAADVTVQSVAALELAAGQEVTFTVKATEVAVYRLDGPRVT